MSHYILSLSVTSNLDYSSGITLSDDWAILWAVIVNGATAGNVQLQWSQKIAEATDTKILANSFIMAHKLG